MTKEKNRFALTLPLILAVVIVSGLVFILKAKSSNAEKPDNASQPIGQTENRSTDQSQPKLEYEKAEFQFGTISMSQGKVKKSFSVKNAGQGNLKISKMATSCMCTTAQLMIGEKKSPLVQMHDGQASWVEELKPGEEGLVEAIFDPAAHGPEGVGEIMRVISFETNDPANKKVELHFSANVVR